MNAISTSRFHDVFLLAGMVMIAGSDFRVAAEESVETFKQKERSLLRQDPDEEKRRTEGKRKVWQAVAAKVKAKRDTATDPKELERISAFSEQASVYIEDPLYTKDDLPEIDYLVDTVFTKYSDTHRETFFYYDSSFVYQSNEVGATSFGMVIGNESISDFEAQGWLNGGGVRIHNGKADLDFTYRHGQIDGDFLYWDTSTGIPITTANLLAQRNEYEVVYRWLDSFDDQLYFAFGGFYHSTTARETVPEGFSFPENGRRVRHHDLDTFGLQLGGGYLIKPKFRLFNIDFNDGMSTMRAGIRLEGFATYGAVFHDGMFDNIFRDSTNGGQENDSIIGIPHRVTLYVKGKASSKLFSHKFANQVGGFCELGYRGIGYYSTLNDNFEYDPSFFARLGLTYYFE